MLEGISADLSILVFMNNDEAFYREFQDTLIYIVITFVNYSVFMITSGNYNRTSLMFFSFTVIFMTMPLLEMVSQLMFEFLISFLTRNPTTLQFMDSSPYTQSCDHPV